MNIKIIINHFLSLLDNITLQFCYFVISLLLLDVKLFL
nr:MAG TPA: hypothetical protein [Caudoviricetes sp.]